VVVLALLAACTPSPRPLPAGDPSRPDIVLVSIDTLRADHLSSYGYTRPTSPFIDELAAAGTRFDQARSASPWTLPAHTTMMTGELPWTHRVVEDSLTLDPATPVLAQSLSAAGYRTGGFVSTLYVSRMFGFDRGFDHFDDFGIHTEKANLKGRVTVDKVIDSAMDWWAEQPAGQPVFLFLHTYDVHYTYDPPAPYATLFDRAPDKHDPHYKNYFFFKKHPLAPAELEHQQAQYDEAIRWVDENLRGLDERLRKSGRTVRWVLTSDHGEELGERGSWGHAHTLYAEQLHVPLVITERRADGTSSLPQGKVVTDTVGTLDLAPTIAAWVPGAGPLQPDGIDLNPALHGTPLPTRSWPASTSRFDTNRIGLLEDGLRLEWDLASDQAELFVAADDPSELHDVAAERPGDVARLEARLQALAGQPWTARVDGTVLTDGSARVLLDGVHTRQGVLAGQRFQVLPLDAPVQFALPGAAPVGPWQAVGGSPPGTTDPLGFDTRATGPQGVVMDEATRKALEALGYVQEAGEE